MMVMDRELMEDYRGPGQLTYSGVGRSRRSLADIDAQDRHACVLRWAGYPGSGLNGELDEFDYQADCDGRLERASAGLRS